MRTPRIRPADVCRYGNAAVVAAIAIFFFVAPVVIIALDLRDLALRGRGIPQCARRWHRALTPKYARWARDRVASDRAANLAKLDVSGTEWPLFGSVFYLLATEALQKDWEEHSAFAQASADKPAGPAPKEYAREAIDAAAELVTDPRHAGWVKKHWGDNYLHTEDCFYRMLLISAATSHAKLTGSLKYLPLLRDQVETLSAEIDNSASGWIDDYPNECYPADVLVATAAIRRADAVLGTDHSPFVSRALRGFRGARLDAGTGLPPYMGNATYGDPMGPARGCGNSYVTTFGPEVWPDEARGWYLLYDKDFWQRRWWAVGFREWPRGTAHGEWYLDVDSGPVVSGFGTSACAFGIGAARTNGRFDQSWPLAAEALVTSWPLPGGTLAGARILSNATEAPYLGEAAMLFNFTRQPLPGVADATGGGLSAYVFIFLFAYLVAGAMLFLAAWLSLRRWRQTPERRVPFEKVQFAAWVALIIAGAVFLFMGFWRFGLVSLLLAQFLPRVREQKSGLPAAAKAFDATGSRPR